MLGLLVQRNSRFNVPPSLTYLSDRVAANSGMFDASGRGSRLQTGYIKRGIVLASQTSSNFSGKAL